MYSSVNKSWRLWVLVALFSVSLPLFAKRVSPHKRKPATAESVRNPFQYILEAEDHRWADDASLIRFVMSQDFRIAKTALRAVGRIGDKAALEEIKTLFDRRRTPSEVKKMAAFALGFIPDPLALKLITQNISFQRDPEVVAALTTSIGRAGNKDSQLFLCNLLKDKESSALILDTAAHAIGTLWASADPSWEVPAGCLDTLTTITLKNDSVGRSAAFALARFRGTPSEIPVKGILTAIPTTSGSVRAFLIRALTRAKSPLATPLVARDAQSTDLGVRIEALKVLATQPLSEESIFALHHKILDPNGSVAVTALESIAAHARDLASLSSKVDTVYKTQKSIWIKGTALKTLAAIDPDLARTRISELIPTPPRELAPYIIASWAVLGAPHDIEKLESFLTQDDNALVADAADAITTLPANRLAPKIAGLLDAALDRLDVTVICNVSANVEKFKWKDFTPHLMAVYRKIKGPDFIEAKTSILSALGTTGDETTIPFLYEALGDDEKSVAQAAADAIQKISGKEESSKVPLNSKVTAVTPTIAETLAALQKPVLIKTTRGDILIQLNPDSPLNNVNFIRLVEKHFYDGLSFHRVVPNFVVQGGDPRGDGYGGPGYFVRDEVSNQIHERGTVGIATAGKDTGGCQFFINLAPNLHLDGKYTMIGHVVRGMEVADGLEIGDKITSIATVK